jgi:hypothetical protein
MNEQEYAYLVIVPGNDVQCYLEEGVAELAAKVVSRQWGGGTIVVCKIPMESFLVGSEGRL